MTKKQALKIATKEIEQRKNFTPDDLEAFQFDNEYIIVYGFVSKTKYDEEARLIIEHNGFDVLTSFIEYL
jgi:hypothetical protein